MSLGGLLKSKRNALGMTLDEVAEAAGCSKSHLHSLESDKCEPGIIGNLTCILDHVLPSPPAL
jgi:transcriptional regulator with XRE-family HTH domain